MEKQQVIKNKIQMNFVLSIFGIFPLRSSFFFLECVFKLLTEKLFLLIFRGNYSMSNENKALTATQIRSKIAEETGKTPKEIGEIIDYLGILIPQELKRVGSFTIPGIVKITTKHKPAKPERQGIDPFTKQPKTFAAKPASITAKAIVLKNIKKIIEPSV